MVGAVTMGIGVWAMHFLGMLAYRLPVSVNGMGLREAATHPHLAQRKSFIELDGVLQPAPAPRFSRTPSAIQPSTISAPAEILARWRPRRPGD